MNRCFRRRGTSSLGWLVAVFLSIPALAPAEDRPNILWITCEDISPNLGCYGDAYASTPHLDRLASEGVRYSLAFSPIGVCAPSRSCLISGMYACSIGSQHMRCQANLPDFVLPFPHYLREAGYYCTNRSKTDYNFQAPKNSWDESSPKAHWRNRQAGQPFFSVFNFTSCHESQIRLAEPQYQKQIAKLAPGQRHDPAKATIPPYHPDTPEVRRDWARYADMISVMDTEAGQVLAELAADKLEDNTIVFFFSDHGAGMPRSKRWLYESSTRVPLLVRFPPKYQAWAPGKAGTTCDRLVSFVDFAPTVLSLAGIAPPKHLQGTAFLGTHAGSPREYVHGYRDRMDERYDLLRSTRDRRYRYIRNYQPQLPYFHEQHISYMYEMPTMRVWQAAADAGTLTGAPALFMAKQKPVEELYDTENDPWEINNLAQSAEHRPILERLRAECRRWQAEIVDLGLMPESVLRSRFADAPPYLTVRQRPDSYPLSALQLAADVANQRDPKMASPLRTLADTPEPLIRYWAAVGLGSLPRLEPADRACLVRLLKDDEASVGMAAADGLCRHGQHEACLETLRTGLKSSNEWVRLAAINILDRLDTQGQSLQATVSALRDDSNEYVGRVARKIVP